MSYQQAHHKPKPVGVPQHQAYQQTRHSTAPRHQQFRSQPPTRDNRPYASITQPPRHPSPIPGQPQGPGLTGSPSPSASPSAVPQQPPPTALGTGAPHDMNKQGAPNRPALTPSPVQQGTILPGHQMLINPVNPQQIMYAQQPNMPRGQTVYMTMQANQRGNPRSGMPMSNISQTQQGGQPQATYQPNQPMTMAAPPFIPSSHSHHSAQQSVQYMMQPQMMTQTNLYTPRQQMPQIQYQPTAVFQQPNTPPFYQGSPPGSAPTGAFFPQNQATLVATQQPQLRQPQGPTMTVQQPTQPRLPQKERKIIRIVDPTSNTDITDTIMREGTSSTGTTPTHSGRSSASSTPPASGPPPPTQQTQQLNDKARAIQASFAAQVASLAAADTTNKPPLPPNQTNSQVMAPQQPHQPSAPQMVPQPQPQPQPLPQPQPQPQQPKTRLAAVPPQGAPVAQVPPSNPPGAPTTVVLPTAVVVDTSKGPIPIASQVQKQAPVPIRPTKVAPVQTPVVSSQSTPIPAPVPAPAVPKQPEEVTDKKVSVAESNSAPDAASELEEKAKTASESVVQQEAAPLSSDKVVTAKDKSAEKLDSKPQEEVEALKEDKTVKVKEEAAVAETIPAKKLSKEEKSGETAKQEPVSKTIPQEETAEKTSSTKEVAAPQKKETSSEAKQAPVRENSKKKSQKKRLQELDKKSTKDEDVYEAYKDKEAPESTPTAPTVEEKKPEVEEEVTPAVEKPQQEEVTEKPTPKEPKTELAKQEKKAKPEPDVESEKLSEKDMPKEVELTVEDSEDKKEREKVEAENAKNKESMDNDDDSNNKPAPKDNKIQLKYTYRDDQWSPVNPEGKKQYGRDFLLQFQPECKDKPDGLPHIPDIVLDKADIRPISVVADPRLATQRGGGGGGSRGGGIDFMPEYMRSPRGSQAPPQFPQPGGRRSSREPKKVIARASQGPEASLKKSENAWKPGKKEEKKNLSEEEIKMEDLIKKFKSILNKLTPQNFQTLMSRTLQLPIDNEERLTAVIDLVFEKAITESAFSKAYANMCRVLSQIKVPAANASGIVQFRTVLINRCQRAFEAEKKEEATWAEMKIEIEKMKEGSTARQTQEEELFILQSKAKQKVLGNMRFIGELFKLRMLTENIMHDCIFKLLRAKDDESLECMSQLMNTVGKDLDHERAKNRMDQYFTQIAKIISNKKISARIRFMLQDVQDLRKSNWVPRRDDNNPKTIAQIHQEAKQEEQQKKIETQLAFHASNKSREKSGRGRPTPHPQQESDWQTVAVSNKGRPQIDPSKLINLGKNRPDNDNVQLGPGGRPGAFGSWGRGSSGGGAKMQSSDQVDLRPAGNNRYAMLSDQGRNRPGMAPPTRDSKGRPTGPIPTRSRERDEGRGSSREDSIKRERMQLLDEVQRTMGGGGARSRSTEKDRKPSRDRGSARGSREGSSRGGGSREGVSRGGGSRDRRGSREAASPSPPVGKSAPKPAGPQLSDEEFEKKGRATLDEYLNIMDFKEACTCLSELNSPDKMHLFVRLSIEHVLEEDAKARLATGALFHRLIIENILSVQQYLQGLNEILEFADDMAIDIPLIWQYLGEVMGSMIRDKSQSLEYLGKALEPVKVSGKAGVLLAEILLTAEKNIGAEDLIELWQSAGFMWEQFLPDDVNVSQFVNSKKLDYTLEKSTHTSQKSISSRSESDSLARMVSELGFKLASDKCVNDDIFDWIKKNVDPEQIKQKDFIRALVTVVCQSTMEGDSSRCDPELLKVRAKSLLRYIDGDVDRELQALFAVQALNHTLVNPPGFLRLIFDVLYDEDVISEETFYAWQNSSDPAEQAGKGVALKSVTSFFAWLGEAEDDIGS